MDENTLQEIWSAIEGVAKVLGSISDRLDRAEGRTDALGVPGSDPVGERREALPKH